MSGGRTFREISLSAEALKKIPAFFPWKAGDDCVNGDASTALLLP